HRARRFRELDRDASEPHSPRGGMVDLDDHVVARDLRVLNDLTVALHPSTPDVMRFKECKPLFSRSRLNHGLDKFIDLISLAESLIERYVSRKRRCIEQRRELLHRGVSDCQVAIRSLVDPVRGGEIRIGYPG